MTWLQVLMFVIQATFIFVASTLVFDIAHYLLHYWRNSRFKILRIFSAWHNVHHDFLDTKIQIHAELERQNFWFHLLPEFVTTVLGTSVFFLVLPWPPVTIVLCLHVVLFIVRIFGHGLDVNHMNMERLKGRRGVFFVSQSYHALHHIFPLQYYSSVVNIFDLVFGTNCQIHNRKFLITGTNGSFGKAIKNKLIARGAHVETAIFNSDYANGDYEGLREKLGRAEVLVLAHGAKQSDCENANFNSFVSIIDMFIETGKSRLVPPEVWAVGSEVELHGDFGLQGLKEYCRTKRAFAGAARKYYHSDDLMYKHIVPSAFTSPMGKGLMSANFAAAYTLFLIRRGFNYIPVTYTGIAWLNYIRFRFFA